MQQVDRQAAKTRKENFGMGRDNKQKIEQSPYKRSHLLAIVGLLVLLFAIISPSAAPAQGLHTTPVRSKVKPTVVATPTPTVPARQIPVLTVHNTADSGDWTSYLGSQHQGDNSVENLIDASTASKLTLFWSAHAKGSISSQPVVANGLIYWGSWDGLEHATDMNGYQVWATYLGTTTDGGCDPSSVGVASTPVVASVTIHGTTTPVVFVGGGNAHFYALNATNGKVIWNVSLGDSPSHFLWSSPTFYRGSVYIGVSSFGDCPEVAGQLVQINASTGAVQNVVNLVPGGCVGATVWSSPTINTNTGELFITTANPDRCGTKEPFATSLIEFHASDLSLVGSWQVPRYQWVIDADFGATPTLFTAKIGSVTTPMVGAVHKNGIFYAFIQGALGDGPVWEDNIAIGGSCPNCGDGSISPAAWDGSKLYVAGGNTYIDGNYCPGSVRAIDPASGAFIWQHCLVNGAVLAPVTTVHGIVVVEDGSEFDILSAASGKTLFSYNDPSIYSLFWGAASISHGVLYIGNFDGNLYAYGLKKNPGVLMKH